MPPKRLKGKANLKTYAQINHRVRMRTRDKFTSLTKAEGAAETLERLLSFYNRNKKGMDTLIAEGALPDVSPYSQDMLMELCRSGFLGIYQGLQPILDIRKQKYLLIYVASMPDFLNERITAELIERLHDPLKTTFIFGQHFSDFVETEFHVSVRDPHGVRTSDNHIFETFLSRLNTCHVRGNVLIATCPDAPLPPFVMVGDSICLVDPSIGGHSVPGGLHTVAWVRDSAHGDSISSVAQNLPMKIGAVMWFEHREVGVSWPDNWFGRERLFYTKWDDLTIHLDKATAEQSG